ncbi:histidine kinase [Tistlia consotensis]|uniref:histidine kinase n=1 Tax=Tistlia consotensis USBA 355 TaxID=560819 RepID=A0A1Y6CLL3_9PROT|nr:ActS/PrrB/RegB family redox-sensitive histidine kinase [Tistlia consotensis]SMF62950.1 histidine kinase [Tistlia consotensis USBA 355]SNR95311.1 histidine kinase [Tistlia consotensis]
MSRTKTALRPEATTLVRRFLPIRPARPAGHVRLRTLIFIRWVAILGQLAALVVVTGGLKFDLPLIEAAGVIAVAGLVNLSVGLMQRGTVWLRDPAATASLGFDLVQLLALLALTGGLDNPFAILVLAPVVVSAATLSRRSTLLLSSIAVVGITLLGLWHLPLPWEEAGLDLPPVYLLGVWAALALSVVFTAAYVSSLASESRRMADALAATQLALEREQRLAALGGLAAAAAHELGSPLATIAVVARELEHEIPPDLPEDSPVRQDLALLRGETERCRQILAELGERPEGDRDSDGDGEDTPFHRLPLAALVEIAAAPFEGEGKALDIVYAPGLQPADQPTLVRRADLVHGLGSLLQNALQFATSRVEVELAWDDETIEVSIRDDGPGFAPQILSDLGDPYVSTGRADARGGRDQRGKDHMGLGVFIAQTLLARSGASLTFANRPSGGAEVAISWQRDHVVATKAGWL